jgi:hypothetical protein
MSRIVANLGGFNKNAARGNNSQQKSARVQQESARCLSLRQQKATKHLNSHQKTTEHPTRGEVSGTKRVDFSPHRSRNTGSGT